MAKWEDIQTKYNTICDKCPKLFSYRESGYGDFQFRFQCGIGWFDLINKLCLYIEPLIDSEDIYVVQIKQKFGGLRFYLNNGNEAIDKLIAEAEKKSYQICENCGDLGKITTIRGWLNTYCDKCKMEKEG